MIHTVWDTPLFRDTVRHFLSARLDAVAANTLGSSPNLVDPEPGFKRAQAFVVHDRYRLGLLDRQWGAAKIDLHVLNTFACGSGRPSRTSARRTCQIPPWTTRTPPSRTRSCSGPDGRPERRGFAEEGGSGGSHPPPVHAAAHAHFTADVAFGYVRDWVPE